MATWWRTILELNVTTSQTFVNFGPQTDKIGSAFYPHFANSAFCFIFTAQGYARAVLRVVILSVSLSVCLSVTRVNCDKCKWCTADVLIPHERTTTLLLWHQQWLVVDLGAAQSSIFGSAQNFFGSLSRLQSKITAQQQSCTQSLFAIFLPKIIKIGGNFTKFWQKQFCTFFWDTVYCFKSIGLCLQGIDMWYGVFVYSQIWHKTCFKCWECGMTLNMKNYKGFDKKPYCSAWVWSDLCYVHFCCCNFCRVFRLDIANILMYSFSVVTTTTNNNLIYKAWVCRET